MGNFSIDLKEQAEKIINFEKAKIVSLTRDERVSYRKQKICYICDKEFSNNDEDKKYHKLEIIAIILEDTEEQLILCIVKNVKCQKRFQ